MFVRMKHEGTGLEAEVAADALPLWRSRGWEPLGKPRSKYQADQELAARQDAEADAMKAEADKPRKAPAVRSFKPAAQSAATEKE